MVFAFMVLIFLSRYAKKTFNTPIKHRRAPKKIPTIKKLKK
jgi:hypothetical protein